MNDNIPAKEHDSTFKFLFEDPKDILFLVRDVIGYKWANQIQMDSIEIVPKLQSLSQTNMERFLIWAGNVIRPRFPKEEREKYDKLAQEVKQGGVRKMGEFVSNVARLLDETKTREFNLGVQNCKFTYK